MTLRQKKDAKKTPKQLRQDVFSEDKIKFILEKMTQRYARILRDYTENRQHPAPCICFLCLSRKYEEDKPVGHPYDLLTFLARDIISEAGDPFQDEEIKNISVKKLAREIIRRLPLFSPETKAVIKSHAWEFERNFETYFRLKRYHAPRFLKLVSQLEYLRHKEWKKSKPEPVAIINFKKKYRTEGQLALGITNFIYSKPDRKVTQRDLCRHLNKPKAAIEPLQEWLKIFYGIEVKIEGKSLIYFATRKPKRRSRS